MKKLLSVALGVVTSIGGFLEAGSIATAAQAGALFGYQLLWAILTGTVMLAFLAEMSGRLAAISHHPLPSAVRERFGFTYCVLPLAAMTIVDLLVLCCEIGGACLGLQLLTGIAFRFWALPVALVAWAFLWWGTFGTLEYGVSLLGLLTVVFVVAALKLHPDFGAAARGLVPSLPRHHAAHYWYLTISIVGATVSPYLFNFYSSGAVEERWNESDLGANRVTAVLGMGFGGFTSMAVLVCAALVFHPRGIDLHDYQQLALLVSGPLGAWGYRILGAALFVACFGAALELSLDLAYSYAQTFGWSWGENKRPAQASRFAMVFTGALLFAGMLMTAGPDPLALTLFSMAATALVLPLVVLPFLVLMNDRKFLGAHVNGPVSNLVVFVALAVCFVIAVVAIPLEVLGG